MHEPFFSSQTQFQNNTIIVPPLKLHVIVGDQVLPLSFPSPLQLLPLPPHPLPPYLFNALLGQSCLTQ